VVFRPSLSYRILNCGMFGYSSMLAARRLTVTEAPTWPKVIKTHNPERWTYIVESRDIHNNVVAMLKICNPTHNFIDDTPRYLAALCCAASTVCCSWHCSLLGRLPPYRFVRIVLDPKVKHGRLFDVINCVKPPCKHSHGPSVRTNKIILMQLRVPTAWNE